jgi:ABC-type transport system involved in multi-copper enzyme maturation permease subunit
MMFDFPLLQRELTQSACRRRTYILRCLIAAVLMLVLLGSYQTVSRNAGHSIAAILGRGTDFAGALLTFCLYMIYLLLPAMSCSTISSEREKQTLGLILISRVTPARLVLEKFLGRLVPMLALLSLTAPLLGIAYAMGGFSVTGIAAAVTLLFVACLQIISAGIMWSSLLKTSMQAFWCTYLTLIALLLVPSILYSCDLLPINGQLFGLEGSSVCFVFYLFLGYGLEVITGRVPMSTFLYSCIPTVSLSILMVLISGTAVSRWRMEAPLNGTGVTKSLPRFFVWTMRLPWQIIRAVFFRKKISRVEPSANEQPERRSRPVSAIRSIGWRELAGSPLTRLPTQGFLLLLILFAVFWLGSLDYVRPPGNVILVHFCLMLVSMLLMLSIGARTFTSERERETLDLLLTTPLSTDDLLRDKLAAASRIRSFLLFAFGILIVFRLFTAESVMDSTLFGNTGNAAYAVCSILYTFLHLTFGKWVAVMFSLMFRTQMKAMIASLLSVLGVCFGLVVCIIILQEILELRGLDSSLILMFFSPYFGYCANETNELNQLSRDIAPEVAVCVNLLCYGLFVGALRMVVSLKAGDWLHRADGEAPFSTKSGIMDW